MEYATEAAAQSDDPPNTPGQPNSPDDHHRPGCWLHGPCVRLFSPCPDPGSDSSAVAIRHGLSAGDAPGIAIGTTAGHPHRPATRVGRPAVIYIATVRAAAVDAYGRTAAAVRTVRIAAIDKYTRTAAVCAAAIDDHARTPAVCAAAIDRDASHTADVNVAVGTTFGSSTRSYAREAADPADASARIHRLDFGVIASGVFEWSGG